MQSCACNLWAPPACCGQVLSVATVGNDQDGLNVETALGQETSSFITHFSCPAFAINEVIPFVLACVFSTELSFTYRTGLKAKAYVLCKSLTLQFGQNLLHGTWGKTHCPKCHADEGEDW